MYTSNNHNAFQLLKNANTHTYIFTLKIG